MDKNQFNNHYQFEDNGRPLHAQVTGEQDYEETSDGYGNQSIEDDIQNIIFQAQQAYANKQITSEEFQMIKGTQQHPSESNYMSQVTQMTNEVITPPDNILMPPNTFLSKLGSNAPKEQSFNSSQMQRIDVTKAFNHQKSNQNIMSSQDNDSKRYIDTNVDKDDVYENNDNMQWTNQLSQIQEEEQPRNYQLRSLENVENNYTDFQDHRIEQTVSVGALPLTLGNRPQHDIDNKGHHTGHFNSHSNKIQMECVPNLDHQQRNPFANQFEGGNSPNIGSEYYIMSSQPVTGRRSREALDSNRPFSSQSRTISQMERNGKYGDRLHSIDKNEKSLEKDGQRNSVKSKSRDSRRSRSNGFRSSAGGGKEQVRSRDQSQDRQRQKSSERRTLTQSITHTESIPQSIHSERSSEYQKSGITQVRDQTIFAQQFKRLYEKIQEIYPQFSKVARSKDIPNLLQSDDMLSAQNIYSQLSFMHEKSIENAAAPTITLVKQNDKELVSLMKDQALSNNNMLKHQIENTQRETEYYKKQMEIFKDQMHKANIREQKLESELSFFKQQVQKNEDQIVKLQRQNTELERKTFELKMNKMNDDTNNISFRGTQTQENINSYNQPYKSPDRSREIHSSSITKSRVLAGGVSPHNRIDLSLATGDNSRMMTQLQGDNKELRSKLKMKEELVGFEKDANQQLNNKIDQMAEEFRSELSQKKKEISELRLDNNERIETIRLMNQQLDNFTEFTSVEFPIMTGPGGQSKRDQSPMSGGINLSNQNKNAQKLVSMRNSKSPILAAIDNEMENMLQTKPFGNDSEDEQEKEQQRKLLKNYHMPTGIRKMDKSPMNRKKQPKKQLQTPIVSLFGLSEMLQSQINSISIVDDVMKELQQKKKNDSNNIDKEIEHMNIIQHNIENLNKEKEDFSILQKTLTKENQDLKQKFSDLLDQFQEYVNESEMKMDDERAMLKQNQDVLHQELNNTIRELEEMSKQLQGDNMKKEEQIERIELEKSQMQKDIDFLKDQAKNQDEQAEQLLKSQIQSLNEEISYLKKHYMVEMDVLRQENTILQDKSTFEKSIKKQQYPGQNDVQEEVRNNNVWQTPGQQDQNNRRDGSADLRLSRQKSQVVCGDNEYIMPFGRSTFNNESFNNNRRGQREEEFHPDDLDSQQRNVRSSSYDKFIAKSRSSRLSRSRERNDRDGSRGRSNERQTSRAKNLISGAQSTFDGLKRELVDKDRLIESKNREIVKLRLENDEIKSNFEQIESLTVNQHQRNRTCNDLNKVTETLRQELERTKINLFKGESGSALSAHHPNFSNMNNDENMTCESKLISSVSENVKELKNLISLASEIFLLSSKFKYGLGSNSGHSPNKLTGSSSNFPPQEFQRLVKENENLQRTVYKYEGALAHIESANKTNPSNDSVQELKRLTQSQLQEIMNLQQQLENMQRQFSEKENGNSQNALQENRVLKTEINLLRENEARNEQLRDGNEELLQERRGLISRIESMEKEYQEGQTQIKERDSHHEELRSRITVIAELFEKKPISQRYSFEVLCDFIHDKAKRLFNKYENAIKDKKMGQDERGYSNQRKIQMLEQELSVQSELLMCLKGFAIPKLYSIVNNGNQISQQEIERVNLSSFVRQLVCEIESSFQRIQADLSQQSQQKFQNQMTNSNSQNVTVNPMHQNSQSNLLAQNNGYSNLVSMRNTPSNINTIHTVQVNNNEPIQQHQLGLSANTSEFEMVKEEKEVLNKKLDEFTKILGEFQKNQQTYEQENQQLKHKIGYLESRTEKTSLSVTQGTAIGQGSVRNGLIPQSNNSGIYSISSTGQPTQVVHFQKQQSQSMGTASHMENETTNVHSMTAEQNNYIGYQQTNC